MALTIALNAWRLNLPCRQDQSMFMFANLRAIKLNLPRHDDYWQPEQDYY